MKFWIQPDWTTNYAPMKVHSKMSRKKMHGILWTGYKQRCASKAPIFNPIYTTTTEFCFASKNKYWIFLRLRNGGVDERHIKLIWFRKWLKFFNISRTEINPLLSSLTYAILNDIKCRFNILLQLHFPKKKRQLKFQKNCSISWSIFWIYLSKLKTSKML